MKELQDAFDRGVESAESTIDMQKHDTATRNATLDAIEESLETCAFYDEMISGEGGCMGQRNGERKCKGCCYFEIDASQLVATIESLRGKP